MSWWKTLSDAHVKFATVFERLDRMSTAHADLEEDVTDAHTRIARLEGAVANSSNPELIRQLSELSMRVALLEMQLRSEEALDPSATRPLLPKSNGQI